MESVRGIIIAGELNLDRGPFISLKTFNEQELRAALLFWDRIDFPEANNLRVFLKPIVLSTFTILQLMQMDQAC